MTEKQMKAVFAETFDAHEAYPSFAAGNVHPQTVARLFGASTAADYRAFLKHATEYAAKA